LREPIFRHEAEVDPVKVSREGSDGFVHFRMIFDPVNGETESAVLGVHEFVPGVDPILPHYHEEVEETVYVVTGTGLLRLGWDPDAMVEHMFEKGAAWFVPPCCYHQIIHTGKEKIKLVASYFRNDGKPISHKRVSYHHTVVHNP